MKCSLLGLYQLKCSVQPMLLPGCRGHVNRVHCKTRHTASDPSTDLSSTWQIQSGKQATLVSVQETMCEKKPRIRGNQAKSVTFLTTTSLRFCLVISKLNHHGARCNVPGKDFQTQQHKERKPRFFSNYYYLRF